MTDHKCERKSRVLREVNTCSGLEFSDQEFCPHSRRWESKTKRINSPKRPSYQFSFCKIISTFEHITLYRRILNISKLHLKYSSVIR